VVRVSLMTRVLNQWFSIFFGPWTQWRIKGVLTGLQPGAPNI